MVWVIMFYYLLMYLKTAGCMTNSADSDQMLAAVHFIPSFKPKTLYMGNASTNSTGNAQYNNLHGFEKKAQNKHPVIHPPQCFLSATAVTTVFPSVNLLKVLPSFTYSAYCNYPKHSDRQAWVNDDDGVLPPFLHYLVILILTLVMLNKLRCHAHFQFSANQITWSRMLIQIQLLNGKQCRSRSVGFFRSQLIWIYTVCKGRIYPGSAGQGLSKLC